MMNPPDLYSPSAEAGVLGSMCIDSKAIPVACAYLEHVDMFFMPENQIIYDCLLSMYIAKKPIDGLLLKNELEAKGQLKQIGGVEYLTRVIQTVPTSANIKYYAKIVVEKYHYRRLKSVIDELQRAVDDGGDVKELLSMAQSKILELDVNSVKPSYLSFSVAQEVSDAPLEAITPTGYTNIDYYVGGLRKGAVMIIAARPGVGKSALMLGIARNIAKRGDCCLIFTLETSAESLIRRAILATTPSEIAELPIIVSTSGDTVEAQIVLFRQLQRTHNVKCVFIDYLQLMRTTERYTSLYQTVTQLSKQVKRFAVNEDIPIVLLAQLNRQSESREGKRPHISDLRDSGGIEQDADVIILLHKQEEYTEAIISKQRDGPTGVAKLVFFPEECQFKDMSYEKTF